MKTKAKESQQVQKARKKIQKKLKAADQRANSETLSAMSSLIKMQLNRHKAEKIDLKKRQLISFDENTHPAKIQSKFILNLIREIKHKIKPQKESLEGRITLTSEANDE